MFGGFILGTGGYLCLNVALFSFILTPHAPGADEVSPMRAVLLALVALGGGLLCLKGSYLAKGIGLGMIVGWSLVSILTQGTCTGLDPEIYKNSEATSSVSH